MKDILEYKGYQGTVEFSKDDSCLYGKVIGIKSLIIYEGQTVKELIENFKGEKWIAKKYNLLMHNCQTFAAKIIKILKAVRINEEDKLRVVEKTKLPGCIINALWHNEELSLKNTLGRIPIFGLFHDIINPK